jgi:CubicO group peptidase (beta-lactamase class C family)
MNKHFPALAIALLLCTTVSAQESTSGGMADPVALEHFFDGVMNDHLRSNHVAGAVVAVVAGGQPVFSKGYGYADYAHKKPVSPDSTLFRIGSISKTFVWTAVMQLVAQGRLDLDTDINGYLREFNIPEGPGGPVTLRHLMTHTPGFEDRLIGLLARDERALRPYGEILKEQLPERIRPAGVEMSYSNHGTGIAAHIVEEVSGMPWDAYAERHIIQPLGMSYTTFRQPLPGQLSGMASKGYNYEDGYLKEYGFEFIPLSAVAGASATAADMARYMLMHLQLGTFQGTEILDSAASTRMQAVAFRVSPYVSGIGLGLYDLIYWNGIRTLGHGGDTFWFHSLMALIPEKNAGLFVSFNSQGGNYAQILGLFLQHFYPLQPPVQEIRLSPEASEKFTGEYRFNRYPHSDLTRVSSILNLNTTRVQYDSGGYLLSREAGAQKKWLAVNDSTFIEENGEEYLVFGKQEKGMYTRAFPGNLAVMPLERVPFIDSGRLHLPVLVFYLTVFLFTLVHWPLVYFVRRRYKPQPGAGQALLPGVKGLGWAASFLALLFIVGLAASLSKPWEILYAVPPAVKILLVIPLVLCPLAAVMLYRAFKLTSKAKYGLSGVVHVYALVIALCLFLWQLNHWNLLGFHY